MRIPRLELLAANIGSRLANTVIEALDLEDISKKFWSDSTTILAWIQRQSPWNLYVFNRVKEIKKSTSCVD